MLASRCGYVCRSCRVKTQQTVALQRHGQGQGQRRNNSSAEEKSEDVPPVRRRLRRKRIPGVGVQEKKMEGAHIKKFYSDKDGEGATTRRKTSPNTPLIRKRLVDTRPLEEYEEDPFKLRVHHQYDDVQPDVRLAPRPNLNLGSLVDRHVHQRAAEATHAASPSSSSNVDFLNNIDAAVERAEAEGTQSSTRENAPLRTASTTNPLFTPAKPAERQQPKSATSFAWKGASMSTWIPHARPGQGFYARMLHTSALRRRQNEAVAASDFPVDDALTPFEGLNASNTSGNVASGGIRAQLRRWQELHGEEEDPLPLIPQDDVVTGDEPYNNLTRLPDETRMRNQAEKDENDLEQEAISTFAASGREGYDGADAIEDGRFLVPGDLVEIEFTRSERESMLAVFVRSIGVTGNYGQFFTMQGKWLHQSERSVQYRLLGFADTAALEALIPHLPYPETMAELKELQDRAYTEDLSVPREVGGPLIAKMLKFFDESQEIYRRHASTLDDAHRILAHDTDLWYGTLASATTTLLKIPASQLPQAAVFAVRKALVHAGFAFNMDRRSHRQTGFFQIRSKAQVNNVEQVRTWVRQWQDDLAKTASMSRRAREKHRSPKGAAIVASFIEKAKAIAAKSRETREPTNGFNIGISKVRLPLTPESDTVKITTGNEFTEEEQEILRFMESWACTNLFMGLNRIESLPPLILHATGLYPDTALGQDVGFMFLQEVGTLLPYENRVRFDQHLLLPSSQHSKPLQNLMHKLIDMRDAHNFQDSMAGLRHDWKDLPVYCIDSAGAHEIDDGISIESGGLDSNGQETHWVHIHIANPTAFFNRDHPLAKMARHMGETIYMPERTYMMLPRWATQRHFSLAPNRPCLTFSAKMDSTGQTIEQKITPGIIRNVIQLTPTEIETLIGDNSLEKLHPMKTYTVGGTPPPPRPRKSRLPEMQATHIAQLTTLNILATHRAAIRRRAGGLFFDSHSPEVSVWQSYKQSGLAWDHPHRKGSRLVTGDPIIELKTRGMVNWFAPSANVVDVLVREFMLLACEISASWCAERDIPVIYRGTTVSKESEAEREKFVEEKLRPNTKADGTYPMWIGQQYIRMVGYTALRTTPLRHGFLGMEHYSKVTSPLRRYGDMILHWQIEAALRFEASTGESLRIKDRKGGKNVAFRPPFSESALKSIMLGLQPREQIVSRSQSYAEVFWVTMFLFRKHRFHEDGGFSDFEHRTMEIPPPIRANGFALEGAWKGPGTTAVESVPIFRAYIPNRPDPSPGVPFIACFLMEFGTTASLVPPEEGGEEVRLGDIWEVRIERVDVFKRQTVVRGVGLVGREAL